MGADVAAGADVREPSFLAACLFGPTGTGKTTLALQLARRFPLEIISVDSAMVYRGMDIGTAKPDPAERSAVPHHLIDVREPWESYSAGRFRADALQLIREISARGRLPLLVGGTLLYFRALLDRLAPLPEADPLVRARIERDAVQRGWPALHAELLRVDPHAATRIAPSDRQRIQRALEVFQLTGRPISALQALPGDVPAVRFLRIALWPIDRQLLYGALDKRLQEMLRVGLLDEVRRLRAMPQVTADCPAMRAVGYRQIWRYLAGEIDRGEAERQAAVATRRLAKRQLTWLQRQPADLAVRVPAVEALDRVTSFLQSSGVSRKPLRCNIMG